jgi:hypothetical protein
MLYKTSPATSYYKPKVAPFARRKSGGSRFRVDGRFGGRVRNDRVCAIPRAKLREFTRLVCNKLLKRSILQVGMVVAL